MHHQHLSAKLTMTQFSISNFFFIFKILVNNAGMVGVWDWKVWNVLANGVIRGTLTALDKMKKGGTIVQMGSVLSVVSGHTEPFPLYSAAKFGVLGLVRSHGEIREKE